MVMLHIKRIQSRMQQHGSIVLLAECPVLSTQNTLIFIFFFFCLLYLYVYFLCFQGGDITPKNIWLTESLLDILSENRQVTF